MNKRFNIVPIEVPTNKRFNIVPGLVAVGSLVAAGAANAAVDLTAIESAGTDIAAVGVAVFAVYVGIKLFKWIRRAL